MATPAKKLVHWSLDPSGSPVFGSPGSEGLSDTTSSSLPYINSQLIAHGFTHQPGLSLEGTNKEDTERVVKCLLAMLSQRMDDMSRTEDLSTKIRTLSYDHERLMSMYRSATEAAANAEREMNMHKSRLTSANRTLQSTENAHKQTTLELQRTRTALQAIRTTHQTEIKKLEKEKDKILERWTKLADAQLGGSINRSGIPVGFRYANADVVEASEVQLRGTGPSLLETALEQSEQARSDLLDENERLKGIIMSVANELQRTLYVALCLTSSDTPEEPSVLTSLELFPFAPANAAWETLSSLIDGIKQSFEPLANSAFLPGSSTAAAVDEDKQAEERAKVREIERLQTTVSNLTRELSDAQNQAKDYASQTQEMFERFAKEQQATNVTIHSKIVAAQNEQNEKIEERARELEEKRQRLTEAHIKLGREKASFEAERIQFLEEKRSWQTQSMDTAYQPAPMAEEAGPSSSIVEHFSPAESPKPSPKRSLRKSPRKSKSSASVVGGGVKKSRAPRRSSGLHKGKGKERASAKVIPSFETEVIAPRASHMQPAFKTNMILPQPQAPRAIAPAFVLPPPSPAAQLPSKDSLFSTNPMPPIGKLDYADPFSHEPQTSQAPPATTSDSTMSYTLNPAPQPPVTPGRRPFPMAKPFAPHMVHAYSPVKPSPLSRILLLGNSPDSPDAPLAAPALGSLTEEDESQEYPRLPAFGHDAQRGPALSLAAELGVSEDDDVPLRDTLNNTFEPPPRPISALGRYPTTRDKGKAKAQPASSRSRQPTVPIEKPKAKPKSAGTQVKTPKVIGGGITKKTTRMTTRSTAAAASTSKAVQKPASKAGPRRVPIGSSEAAAPPTWKG
ncbi:hypothetical protein BDW22DRAFT_1422215 [Trametopsis cervina]|nr:hypothetical protein BDW22DRAFT_1422215 [Trametopsis cervina]